MHSPVNYPEGKSSVVPGALKDFYRVKYINYIYHIYTVSCSVNLGGLTLERQHKVG